MYRTQNLVHSKLYLFSVFQKNKKSTIYNEKLDARFSFSKKGRVYNSPPPFHLDIRGTLNVSFEYSVVIQTGHIWIIRIDDSKVFDEYVIFI